MGAHQFADSTHTSARHDLCYEMNMSVILTTAIVALAPRLVSPRRAMANRRHRQKDCKELRVARTHQQVRDPQFHTTPKCPEARASA
jgi:hypothetical protein